MSDFITRMKMYRERLNRSQTNLNERVDMRRETMIRPGKGQYNRSLELVVDTTKEFRTTLENVFIFPENEEEDEQGSDFDMLEAGYIDLYDEAYQKGFEIGISISTLRMLTRMVGHVKSFLSAESWEKYKKKLENRFKKHLAEHPEDQGKRPDFFDEEGRLVKEEWVKEKKKILDCMGFHEGSWDEICAFVGKYPELPPSALARRIIRESEYKYI